MVKMAFRYFISFQKKYCYHKYLHEAGANYPYRSSRNESYVEHSLTKPTYQFLLRYLMKALFKRKIWSKPREFSRLRNFEYYFSAQH